MSFPTPISIEDKSLTKNARVTVMTFVALLLASALLTPALAQKATQHLLSSDELTKVAPAEFFFRGQKATVQLRNATGFEATSGMVTFGALVDASGYSSSIQEKYQGLFITESKLNIGGSELAPGAYGFGFTKDKFIVMNVASEDVLSVPYSTDAELKRAVPLKMVEDGAGFKLYAGKKWVAVKPE